MATAATAPDPPAQDIEDDRHERRTSPGFAATVAVGLALLVGSSVASGCARTAVTA